MLDSVENISITNGVSPITNYQSIHHLRYGILMLYNNMKDLESEYWERREPDANSVKMKFFKQSTIALNFEFNPVDSMGINLCYWYSVHLMNYANTCALVQFIHQNGVLPEKIGEDSTLKKGLRDHRFSYLKSIQELVPIKFFRHKTGAHIALSDPHEKDNPATLINSLNITPAFINGRFKVGSVQWGKGDHLSEFGNHEWSLTENFESLKARYFPDQIDSDIK